MPCREDGSCMDMVEPPGMEQRSLGERTCRHGRARESEMIAQRVAGVFRAEQTAPLQLGHYECHKVVEVAGKQRRGEDEAVAGFGFEPGREVISDLCR